MAVPQDASIVVVPQDAVFASVGVCGFTVSGFGEESCVIGRAMALVWEGISTILDSVWRVSCF